MFKRNLLLFLLPMLGQSFDKYEDAVKKYESWKARYGFPLAKRTDRETGQHKHSLTNAGFLPHRPVSGGRRFLIDEPSQQASELGLLENEVYSPYVLRGTRESHATVDEIGLGGSEYISAYGEPLYKIRKRYPHYGRKKRDIEFLPVLKRVPRQDSTDGKKGWTLLDPNTGRPVELAMPDLEPNQRVPRKPENEESQVTDDESINYKTFEDKDGQVQPIYKYYKKYPFGYSG